MDNLELDFAHSLQKFKVCTDLIIRLSSDFVVIGVRGTDGTSQGEVTISVRAGYDSKPYEPTINYGISGAFSPKDRVCYWRTKHAASILDNWDKIIALTKEFCEKYKQSVK